MNVRDRYVGVEVLKGKCRFASFIFFGLFFCFIDCGNLDRGTNERNIEECVIKWIFYEVGIGLHFDFTDKR